MSPAVLNFDRMLVYGDHDIATVEQLARCLDAEEDARGVLCADGHRGYSMPIGGVVAYREHVSPSGVGYDIACGNLAVQTALRSRDLDAADWPRLADEIQRRISFGIGRKNNEPIDHPVLDAIAKSPIPQQARLIAMAREQLGTVGSGNHYVDVLEDQYGYLWVGVHFGSRGFGWNTARGFMNVAQGREWSANGGHEDMDAQPLLLRLDQPAGQDYLTAMELAGRYAYAGREAVVAKVCQMLGTDWTFKVHNHHNFAWQEDHAGESWLVIRKGATPAFHGQWGFVGGSMGDMSVVLRGVESPGSRAALYSTVHGAGRVMSRTQAAGKQHWSKARWTCGNHRVCAFTAAAKEFERGPQGELPKCPDCGSKLRRHGAVMSRSGGGLVDFDAEKGKLAAQGIELRGAGADEAPPVYRRLEGVLEAHADTIEVVFTLQPKIVVMAGADEHDPFRD